jgi:16S rRNA (cytosine967-C5)-methyltransferase
LYYSTCSIFQEENDGVVEAFLKTHEEYASVEISSPLDYEKKKYGLQFLPDTAYGAGFYVCKLERKS